MGGSGSGEWRERGLKSENAPVWRRAGRAADVRYGSKAEKLVLSICCPLYPRCVDGSELARTFFTFAALVGALVCYGPLDAVHTTAGHNALRGSGPDRKPAFDNAWGQLGCPDRRIDRLCITCCSSSQPSHHAGCPARSRLCRKRDGFLIVLALGHRSPMPSGRSCWQARWRRSWCGAAPAML